MGLGAARVKEELGRGERGVEAVVRRGNAAGDGAFEDVLEVLVAALLGEGVDEEAHGSECGVVCFAWLRVA